MIFVLNNAPYRYHHIHAEDYIDPPTMKCAKLSEELLLTAEFDSIEVERDGKTRKFDLKTTRKKKR